ncbi:MAG: aminotransferase class I/II-fold pyridoxal phosphate-dependent enzyme [Pseudomonadota bacterium]
MLDRQTLTLLDDALASVDAGFAALPAHAAAPDLESLREPLLAVAERMRDNYPYPHPLYAGQMLKPPHPVARLAYSLALFINPNNHALDGGRASSALEKEAVAELAAMVGWERFLGHLTSGGTMANLEALWVADQTHPGKVVLASAQAHYTHGRICGVLKIPFESVATDRHARMDLAALRERLARGDVGTIVATLGTTGTGSVDPLPGILALAAEYGARVHVDAAYGGYFTLADNLTDAAAAAYAAVDRTDSLVIDPHKHGLQPYGCGCVLFRDPATGRFYQHDSPYTYFSSDELHLGEISLECSRAGAAAVALWTTQRLLPPVPGGAFAADLGRCRQAALDLHARLRDDPRVLTLFEPELDIVLWAPAAATRQAISALSKRHFREAADRHLHLALIELPDDLIPPDWPAAEAPDETVTCLRSCLMKPEHAEWIEPIWEILDALLSASTAKG